jgi:ABC-2 type transport system ATP-binding protein
LQKKLKQLPKELSEKNVKLSADGLSITYIYDTKQKKTGITKLLSNLSNSGINLRDIQTDQSSLEEIFVNLVREKVE